MPFACVLSKMFSFSIDFKTSLPILQTLFFDTEENFSREFSVKMTHCLRITAHVEIETDLQLKTQLFISTFSIKL